MMEYKYITEYDSPNFGYPIGTHNQNKPKQIVIHHWGSDDSTFTEGSQGIEEGAEEAEKATGQGVQGTFDLNGRSISGSGLPVPEKKVQEEGRVVVTITVNPAGQVIATSINLRTNTSNSELRKAAEDAAKRARFNQIDGIDNQTGTITYYFKLK